MSDLNWGDGVSSLLVMERSTYSWLGIRLGNVARWRKITGRKLVRELEKRRNFQGRFKARLRESG